MLLYINKASSALLSGLGLEHGWPPIEDIDISPTRPIHRLKTLLLIQNPSNVRCIGFAHVTLIHLVVERMIVHYCQFECQLAFENKSNGFGRDTSSFMPSLSFISCVVHEFSGAHRHLGLG